MSSSDDIIFEEIEGMGVAPPSHVLKQMEKLQDDYWDLHKESEERLELLRELVECADDPEELEEVISKIKRVLESNPILEYDL